jgi:hypothetical protein
MNAAVVRDRVNNLKVLEADPTEYVRRVRAGAHRSYSIS